MDRSVRDAGTSRRDGNPAVRGNRMLSFGVVGQLAGCHRLHLGAQKTHKAVGEDRAWPLRVEGGECLERSRFLNRLDDHIRLPCRPCNRQLVNDCHAQIFGHQGHHHLARTGLYAVVNRYAVLAKRCRQYPAIWIIRIDLFYFLQADDQFGSALVYLFSNPFRDQCVASIFGGNSQIALRQLIL